MDGIASGRPVISTDIPECNLYPDWIEIVRSPESAAVAIRQHLSRSGTPAAIAKSTRQLEFVRQQTWQVRARTLTREFWS